MTTDYFQTVACGQCLGCRMERARQWAVRIMHETRLHDDALFLTLTYSDQHLPPAGTLVKKHPQLFFKKLRKKIQPRKIRYFMCGEYGGKFGRPHYHVILWGYRFPDMKFFTNSGENPLYTSQILDDLWEYGHCQIGSVSYDSARYVAKYCTEKLTGELGKNEYEATGRIPPYSTQSTKPGIGHDFLEKFGDDVYNYDEVLMNGFPGKPPRYYDKILERTDPERYAENKRSRKKRAQELHPDRLIARETILKNQLRKS